MEIVLITDEKMEEASINMDCSPGDCSPVNRCNPDDANISQVVPSSVE